MTTDVLTFALAGNPNAGKTTLFKVMTAAAEGATIRADGERRSVTGTRR